MRAFIIVAFFGALLVPATAAAAGERPIVLALNPQPEPPGKAKIKRIYSGKDDSRRQIKKSNQKPQGLTAPATK